MKQILAILAVIVLCVGVVSVAGATSTTKAAVKSTVNNVALYGLSASHTLAAATDTLIVTFSARTAANQSAIGTLLIGTTSVNGDSVAIGVRYQYSYDGTNWGSVTLGTDSTTWVSTATGSSKTVNFVALTTTSHPDAPYKRIMVVGQAGNNAGTKVDVQIQPTNQ